MASTKLSAEDKKAIVKLYQEVGQTAATVAEQYGVSVSTISRLLKSELPPEAYEALVRQKRGGGETKSKKRSSRKKPVSKLKKAASKAADTTTGTNEAVAVDTEVEAPDAASEAEKVPTRSRRRRTRITSEKKRPVSRRKSKEPDEDLVSETTVEEATAEETNSEVVEVATALDAEETSTGRQKPIRRTRPRLKQTTEVEEAVEDEATVETVGTPEVADEAPEPRPRRRTRRRTRARDVAEEVPTPIEEVVATEEEAKPFVESDDAVELALDDLTETMDSEDEDFDDAFDDDDDLEDEEDDGSDKITSLRRRSSGADIVQIQPLSEANLSRMLYLVIDRTADLITMPMVFFSDLGDLPEEEEKKKTLPVFENHRVARRFSQRNQRVIKVPDGELISKTAAWLEAKGITRCLLDGQVYSLESADR